MFHATVDERSVAEVCRQNLREEEAMAEFLDSNIERAGQEACSHTMDA